eukprot:scaffold558251_cov24-Prasinocladus_malaysianus.AAC.1
MVLSKQRDDLCLVSAPLNCPPLHQLKDGDGQRMGIGLRWRIISTWLMGAGIVGRHRDSGPRQVGGLHAPEALNKLLAAS